MTKKEAAEWIKRRDLINFIDYVSISPSCKEALKIACKELVKKVEKEG